MCEFEFELRETIIGFVEENTPFTSRMVRDGIRELNMPIRYKEANYATLTHMQHNASEYGYAARSIRVVTGQDILGQDEHAQVWEFAPIKTIADEFEPKSDTEDEIVVTQKSGGGFFARIFNK